MRARTIVLLFSTLVLFSTAPARAQPPGGAFTPADASDVRATVVRYFDAFSRRDFTAFRGLFQAPFLLFGTTPQIVPTLDEVVARWERIRTSLDGRDYAASKAIDVRVTPLDARRALADIRWQRFRRNGAVLDEGAEIYAMCKAADGWKLCGNIGQALDQYGKVY